MRCLVASGLVVLSAVFTPTASLAKQPIVKEAVEAKKLYLQLKSFRKQRGFAVYGFGRDPYAAWMERLKRLREDERLKVGLCRAGYSWDEIATHLIGHALDTMWIASRPKGQSGVDMKQYRMIDAIFENLHIREMIKPPEFFKKGKVYRLQMTFPSDVCPKKDDYVQMEELLRADTTGDLSVDYLNRNCTQVEPGAVAKILSGPHSLGKIHDEVYQAKVGKATVWIERGQFQY